MTVYKRSKKHNLSAAFAEKGNDSKYIFLNFLIFYYYPRHLETFIKALPEIRDNYNENQTSPGMYSFGDNEMGHIEISMYKLSDQSFYPSEKVTTDEYGFSLDAMEAGRLMAHYYIRFKTMISICQAPRHCSMPDIIMIIAKAEEFSSIRLRR